MTVRTIYLVRHGQYDQTVPYLGVPGGNLTPLGRDQARYVAETFVNYSINSIHCSTMPRAIETSHIIARKLNKEVKKSDLLQEGVPSIPSHLKNEFEKLMKERPDLTHEKIKHNLERFEKAYATYFYSPSTLEDDTIDILVCHGNIIRFFLCKVLGIHIDNWVKFDVNNGGISCVTIKDNGMMQILHMNESKHIPLNKQTFT